MTPTPGRAPVVAIALLSAAGLALEILLMRLLAIVHWHHFAYMILSVALLGFGASGTLLALMPRLRDYRLAFVGNALLFALTAVGCALAAERVPFNTLEVLWDPAQWRWLATVYALLALPFFFLANAVALTLRRFPRDIGRVYGFDLMGAGLGACGMLLALQVMKPQDALFATGALALTAAALGAIEVRARGRLASAALTVAAIAALTWLPPSWREVPMTAYKGLPQALRVPGARLVAEHSSPMSLLSVIESPQVPLRHAPGSSLSQHAPIPAQLGLFTDGDGLSAITRFDGDVRVLRYLDALTSALPYHLLESPRVFVIGANGDAMLQAFAAGAPRVDVAEVDRNRAALFQQDFAYWFGWKHVNRIVSLHVDDARRFLERTSGEYDLIVFPLVESSAAAGAGVHALLEDFLLTREAFRLYWRRLTPGGALSFTRWVRLPPREELKLIDTAMGMLREAGIEDPGEHLAFVRGFQTSTLYVSRAALTTRQRAALARFAQTRSFDVDHPPELAEGAQFNHLPEPYYARAIAALSGENRDRFIAEYPFAIAAATDDEPYFSHLFRWRTAPRIMELKAVGGLALFEWGYPVIVITLLQAVVASTLLIAAPLFWLRNAREGLQRGAVLIGYFGAVGLGFMFLEIAFLQRFTRVLGHPIFSAAAVLATFLIGAGLGSHWGARLAKSYQPVSVLRGAALVVAAVALIEMLMLPALFALLSPAGTLVHATVAIAAMLPLAVVLGMPFPMGLALVSARPGALAWAWGINGCASVIGAVLAALLAVHFGSSSVIALAALGYVSVALLGPRLARS